VQDYLNAGVQPEKIVLGVPFYAHVWGQVPDTNHGLFQPGKELPHGGEWRSGGPDAMMKDGFVRYFDPVAGVPYLYNPEKKIFATYEDAQSLAGKCKYVLDHHLAGIMFWDYESDTTGALLDAVNAGLASGLSTEGGSK